VRPVNQCHAVQQKQFLVHGKRVAQRE
jgi:hypothetical protein